MMTLVTYDISLEDAGGVKKAALGSKAVHELRHQSSEFCV